MQPPWSEIGRLQSDVNDIKAKILYSPKNHEVHAISRRLDSMEHSLRDIRTEIDGLLNRLQTVEENQIIST